MHGVFILFHGTVYPSNLFSIFIDVFSFPAMDIRVQRNNEVDYFLENEEYRPFDGCKIEI